MCFFAGGWWFFVNHLFRNYEVRNVLVQLIFSVTFSLSLTMFELIIFEIVGVMESSSRYFHWRLGLTLLLVMCIALIPFYIAYSCISNIRIGSFIDLHVYSFKIIEIKCIVFSSGQMDTHTVLNRLVHVFVRFLAHWRSIPVAERVPGNIYYRTGRLSNRSDWRNSNGRSVRIWCRQLSVHQHDVLYSVNN